MKLTENNIFLQKKVLLLSAAILFVVSLFTSFYFSEKPSVAYEEIMLEHYLHTQQKDYQALLQDTVLMKKLVLHKESLEEFREVEDKKYGVFLFTEHGTGENDLVFWNTQKILPPIAGHDTPDGEYFQKLANGYYYIFKKRLTISGIGHATVAYILVPVLYRYEFQNSSYLRTHFVHDDNAHEKIFIGDAKTSYPVNSLTGKTLFYIDRKAYAPADQLDGLTTFLRLLVLAFLLMYIHFTTAIVKQRQGPVKAAVFLTCLLLILRLLLYIFPKLFALRQFQLFDDLTIYSANWLHRSLGDLLLNSIFFCWIVVYCWFNLEPIRKIPAFLKGNRLLVAGVAVLFLIIFTSFQFANVVRSLVRDSQISFNVTDFFSLDIYTVVGFIVLALLALSYYYFTRILFRFVFLAFEGKTIYVFFVIAATGLFYLTLRTGNNIILFHLPVLLWLLGYTLVISRERFIINRFQATIAGILFWIFLFSVSLAAIILKENREKELVVRKSIAERYDEVTDPSGEKTLSIALTYLDNDFLRANFHRFQNPVQNRKIRDSIISANIVGYLNKYDTRIFVFDSSLQPVNNSENLTFAELDNLFNEQSKPTEIEDLHYHETSYNQLTYITKRSIKDSLQLGTFFIISTPKKYSTDALYPELFRPTSETDAENSPVYSYAVYKNKLLIAASTKYPFSTSLAPLDVPILEYERRMRDGYDELWYRAANQKVIVVVKKQDSLIESITLFSYLFCSFLIMVALLQLLTLLLRAGEDRKVLSAFMQLNIRSQIHSTIIFISVFSFFIIGLATIQFFTARYNRNNIDKLSRTTGIMVREMQKRLMASSTFDDVIKIYDSVTNTNLQQLINEVAEIHNVDVNVYDLQGNLQVSSEAEVYRRGILSTKMHPEAYYHLVRMKNVQYVQEETMSSLEYLSIYAAVRDEKGQVYAYLNIPYFLSHIDINQEISNFLVTIINLNAFIFLIAGIIALFITNTITRSLTIIGDKMKAVTLGRTNEEIVWKRNDEIGQLVKQYNAMVHQLEASAMALAKSEREGAWREMARQVAHEIKNPLTPMKLSIQYLQKAINNNQPNIKELTGNVALTLVEQIDHLSKIAADFSQFANIGNYKPQEFDLHSVLQGLVDLFSTNSHVQLTWKPVEGPVMMKADKTQLNRLFTNLITNAIQACSGDATCHVRIAELIRDGYVSVKIQDDGEGIPEEIRDRIFTPNFTTKSSGTGLGLAMYKSIVEQAGGDIWFETEIGKGTSFFVRLPVLQG